MKVLNNTKKKLQEGFSKLEHSTGPFMKLAVGMVVLGGCLIIGGYLSKDKSEITTSTVMITTMDERGGGTGVVVDSNEKESYVLTNKHVCGIAPKGGLVKTSDGQKHLIQSFIESQLHDLCLIKVASRLPGKVTLARSAPQLFENATISGHPALLPTVLTKGHFSNNLVISVFEGMRPCTPEEQQNEVLGLSCLFFGGLPIVRMHEATLVTATIMPGSSGSAVYNNDKELSALVFAGSGDIGYAFAVPFEYVSNFLNTEAWLYQPKVVNYTLSVELLMQQKNIFDHNIKHVVDKCTKELDTITDTNSRKSIEDVCKLIIRDFNWRNGK